MVGDINERRQNKELIVSAGNHSCVKRNVFAQNGEIVARAVPVEEFLVKQINALADTLDMCCRLLLHFLYIDMMRILLHHLQI